MNQNKMLKHLLKVNSNLKILRMMNHKMSMILHHLLLLLKRNKNNNMFKNMMKRVSLSQKNLTKKRNIKSLNKFNHHKMSDHKNNNSKKNLENLISLKKNQMMVKKSIKLSMMNHQNKNKNKIIIYNTKENK